MKLHPKFISEEEILSARLINEKIDKKLNPNLLNLE